MKTALILIDIQKGFDHPFWGERNNPDAVANAARLLDHWRTTQQDIIHIQHISQEPDSPLGPHTEGTEFKPEVAPKAGETIFQKNVNSAFIGTNLEAHLRDADISALVICGLTTPHCVSTSSRMGANLGFDVTLAHDACAAFTCNANTSWNNTARMTAEEIHNSAISHLHGEFVTACPTLDIISRF